VLQSPESPAGQPELRDVRSGRIGPWLLCIYKTEDKNNRRLNRCLMGLFRRFLQDMELSDLCLNGCLYTWSNKQTHPTLKRIDRVFTCLQWCDRFPHHRLRTTSIACSDHAPFILHTNTMSLVKSRFKFETIWPKFPGYLEAVKEGWRPSLPRANPFRNLDFMFRNTDLKALEPELYR
jgi:hypothetical protein